MNYSKINKVDLANGEGVRVTLFVSGCKCHCKGCFNKETWDFHYGKPFDNNAKQELFEALNKPYIKGITISGGNPLEQGNQTAIYFLVQEIKKRFPTKDIWIYTGYTWEELQNIREAQHILCYTDVLVDGKYDEKQRDITLSFRGSSNQRIINVHKSLKNNKVILYEL